MTRPALTCRQEAIWDFIVDRICETGRSPTIREIAFEFGFMALNAVQTHVRLIVAKGYLVDSSDGTSRGLSVPGLTAHLAPHAWRFVAGFKPVPVAATANRGAS